MSLTKLKIIKDANGNITQAFLSRKKPETLSLESFTKKEKTELIQALNLLDQIERLEKLEKNQAESKELEALLEQCEASLLSLLQEREGEIQSETILFESLAFLYEAYGRFYKSQNRSESEKACLEKALAYRLQASVKEENFASCYALIVLLFDLYRLELQDQASEKEALLYVNQALDYIKKAETIAKGAKKELLYKYKQLCLQLLADGKRMEGEAKEAIALYNQLWTELIHQAHQSYFKLKFSLHPLILDQLAEWEAFYEKQQGFGELFDYYLESLPSILIPLLWVDHSPESFARIQALSLAVGSRLEKRQQAEKALKFLEELKEILDDKLIMMPTVDEQSIPFFRLEKDLLMSMARLYESLGKSRKAQSALVEAQEDFNLVCFTDISDETILEKLELDLKLAKLYDRNKKVVEEEELLSGILEEIDNYKNTFSENGISTQLQIIQIETLGLLAKVLEKLKPKKAENVLARAIEQFDSQLLKGMNLLEAERLSWIYELAARTFSRKRESEKADLYFRKAESLKRSTGKSPKKAFEAGLLENEKERP